MEISCLIPVYKNDNPVFIRQAIDSILAQSLKPSEILILVDGPVGDSINNLLNEYVAKNNTIQIVKFPTNRGLGLTLRDGVLLAKGPLIARMDSDDISTGERFKKQEEFLSNHPDICLVGSNTIEFIDSPENIVSRRIMPENDSQIKLYAKTRNPFIHPSVMFYKSAAVKAGNYDNWFLCEDYDLWAKMIMQDVKMHNIQDNLVFMRISKDFYKRRGGIKYCRSILRFKYHLLKIKFMNWKQFFASSIPSLCVALCPNTIREFIYKRYLRK